MNNFNKKIQPLNEFNLDGTPEDIFNNYREKFFRIFPKTPTFPQVKIDTSQLILSRARKVDTPEEIEFIKNVWHRDYGYFNPGRFNLPSERLLYTSENNNTAILEIAPEIGQFVAISEFTIAGLTDIHCLDFREKNNSTLSLEDNNWLNFIVQKSQEAVGQKEQHKYYPTSMLAISLKDNAFDAIAYKSVKNNLYRNNFAFRPKFAEKHFRFHELRIIKIIDKPAEDTFKVKCIARSNEIRPDFGFFYPDSKFLTFKVKNCNGHSISLESSSRIHPYPISFTNASTSE